MIDCNLQLSEVDRGRQIHVMVDALPHGGEARRLLPPSVRRQLAALSERGQRLAEDGSGESEAVRFGRELFDLIFDGEGRQVYERARVQEGPLRLVVKLGESPELHRVAWELLHDGSRFLASDPRSAVVRYLEQARPVARLEVEPPLRVLVTMANPGDREPLDLRAEEMAIRLAHAEAGERVELQVERSVCLETLESLWRQASRNGAPFHVWHHCGHGAATPGEGRFELSLEKDGHSEPATVAQISGIAGYCPELRLAIFSVCLGASLLGPAPALARLDVPALIGFPRQVEDAVAIKFAAALHQLLATLPLELAVSLARRYLKIVAPEPLEWSQPLLFSRRRDSGPLLASKSQMAPREDGARQQAPDLDISIKGGRIGKIGTLGGRGGGPMPRVRIRQEDVEVAEIGLVGFESTGLLSANERRAGEERLLRLTRSLDAYLAAMH